MDIVPTIRTSFRGWDIKWESKTYYPSIGKKKYYVGYFMLSYLPKDSSGSSQRRINLWFKDIYSPGKPCYIAKIPLYDFTTLLMRNLKNKTEWESKIIHGQRHHRRTHSIKFYLTFKECKNGTIRPKMKMSIKDFYEVGKPTYYCKIRIHDFVDVTRLLLQCGYKKYSTYATIKKRVSCNPLH